MEKKIFRKVDSPEYFEYLARHYFEQAKIAATYGVPEVVCRDLDSAANTLMRCARLLRTKRQIKRR